MMQSEPVTIGDGKNDITEQLGQFSNSPMNVLHRNIKSSQMARRSDVLGQKIVRFPEINRGLEENNERNFKAKYSAALKVVLQGQRGNEINEKLKEEEDDVLPKQIQHVQTDINQSRQHIKLGRIAYQPTSRLSSLLGRIKKDRKESEEELRIIENRVKILKKEEEKTQKKTEQIRQKSEDIALIKQRHAFELQQRQNVMKEEAEKAALAKENAQKKKEKTKHLDNLGELLLRNHEMYKQTKREKELSKIIISEMTQNDIEENARHVRKMRKKQAAVLKKIKEQKAGVEKIIERYQDEFQAETLLKWEKDQKIVQLEENEQMLIKRLQKSRNVQRQSIMHLQEISQLKPADVMAKVNKSITPTNSIINKMPEKMFNLSQRDVFKDKDDYQSYRKGSQSVKGTRRRMDLGEQSFQLQLQDRNISDLKMPKRRIVALKELKINNPINLQENQGQIEEIIDNCSNKSNKSNDKLNLREDSKDTNTIILPDLIPHLPQQNSISQKNTEQCQTLESKTANNHKSDLSSVKQDQDEEKRDLDNFQKEDSLDKKEIINISAHDIVLHKCNDSMPTKLKQLSLIQPQITLKIPKKKSKRCRSISDNLSNNNNNLSDILPAEIKDSEGQKKFKKPFRKPRAQSKNSTKQEQKLSSPSVYLQPTILPYTGLNPTQIKFLMQVSRRKPGSLMTTIPFYDNSVSKPDMVF